jgi:hypothetical protein
MGESLHPPRAMSRFVTRSILLSGFIALIGTSELWRTNPTAGF